MPRSPMAPRITMSSPASIWTARDRTPTRPAPRPPLAPRCPRHGSMATSAPPPDSPATVFSGGQVTVSGAGDQVRPGSVAAQPTPSGLSTSRSLVTAPSRQGLVSQTGTNSARRAGVMIRESLAANSRHASTLITPATSNNRTFSGRTTANNNATATSVTNTNSWVRIVRAGQHVHLVHISRRIKLDANYHQSCSLHDGICGTVLRRPRRLLRQHPPSAPPSSAMSPSPAAIPPASRLQRATRRSHCPGTAVAGASSYRVKRATVAGGPYTTARPAPRRTASSTPPPPTTRRIIMSFPLTTARASRPTLRKFSPRHPRLCHRCRWVCWPAIRDQACSCHGRPPPMPPATG